MLSPNANPPLDQEAEDPPLGAFVSTEKSPDHAGPTQSAEAEDAPIAVSPIDMAFAACRAVGGGDGVFGNTWKDRLIEVVQPAFALFCLTHDQPAEVARLAYLADIPFTKAAKDNLALVTVKLAARPKDTDQDKICSDWSALLRCAHTQKILPDDFVAWVGTTTVRGCKATIAREKAAARTEAGQAPPKRNQKQLDAAGPKDTFMSAGELADMLTSIQAAVLDALTVPGSEAEQRERVVATLQAFVDGHTTPGRIELDNKGDDATAEVAND